MRPGHIECAPEFYSYMRRYPQLNDTSVVWNQVPSHVRHTPVALIWWHLYRGT